MMDKKVLRKRVKQRILTIPSRKKESDAIIEHIRDLKEYRESRTILMFIPLPDEPDISPLLDDSRVLLPYIEDGALHFSSSRILHRADYGALEAEHTEAMYDSALMIVPLLGYSSSLGRLGRGGGYYDRYIRENRNRIITAGVAFSVSFLPEFIPEEHDALLDIVITPDAVVRRSEI